MTTPDLLDRWIAEARDQAAMFGHAVVVNTAHRYGALFPVYHPEAEPPAAEPPAGENLANVLASVEDYVVPDRLYVWPSGLVAGPDRVNWVWAFPRGEYRMGFARQAEDYCHRRRINPADVWGVWAHEIHGTCVFVPGKTFDQNPRDWRMVQAQAFPS